jgi:Tfp pilus assembly PilM family ATPase
MIPLPFGKKNKGRIGIAICDGGVTIGQCSWSHGKYLNPAVHTIPDNPKKYTSTDWQNILSSCGVLGTECTISLSPQIAHHQVLRMPNMDEAESKEAAAWEMADRIGVDRSTLQIDAVQIGSGGDVLAIAIEQNTLSSLLEPIYEAGLQPILIEAQCISVARTMSMLHRRQSDQSIVHSVLDFGMKDSALMVLSGNSLMFYKQLPYSGDLLIDSISSHTGVTVKQATKMLSASNDSTKDDDIRKAVRDATRATHEAIATDAMKCIRHYGVTNRGPLSTKMIITGSSGWNMHLSEVLHLACNQEIMPDVSLKHVNSLPSATVQSSGWHIALGASLAEFSEVQQRRGSDCSTKEAA